MPEETRELEEMSFILAQSSAALGSAVHPRTRDSLIEVVRSMNSYYSNLIEGHNTHPLDIEKALASDYSADPAKRALQLESLAHIQVQRLIEERLSGDASTEICAPEFLQWIHREFYTRLPDQFRHVRTASGGYDTVEPGELRRGEVEVARHIAPKSSALSGFLKRFQAGYEPEKLPPMQRVIAAAASHHRLAWIHPFLDGNGRVARLFTHAYLIKTGIDGHRLWMVSRGFARSKSGYVSALAAADSRRHHDFDGRGNLSERALIEFCTFFLKTSLDQVEFMSGLFEFDSMRNRLMAFAADWCRGAQQTSLRKMAGRIGHLLSDLFVRGELQRGEVTTLLGIPERTARELLKGLLQTGLITSPGPGKPVRMGFPASVLGYYFPKLYPDSIATDLTVSNLSKKPSD